MEVNVKNTLGTAFYLPIYQPSSPSTDQSFIPAGATVDLIADGNATRAEIVVSSQLLSGLTDGDLVLIWDGVQLTTAATQTAFSIIRGVASSVRVTNTFLDNASATIPLQFAGHDLNDALVKNVAISFAFTVDSVTTTGSVSAVKTASGWHTFSPALESSGTPNEDLAYSVDADGSGDLSLTVTGSGTGESVSFKSLPNVHYGI